MKRILFVVAITMVATAQNSKIITSKSETPVFSAWGGAVSCGGLEATVWSDSKGWHSADCLEIATKLSELRDVREVFVASGPDVPMMLAYSQYEGEFRISHDDFTQAQAQCEKILREGWAHVDILAQCKKTVAGVVPYGLKLKASAAQ